MSELIGGRFRLLEKVGAGGMGVVHRAVDERDGGTVAIKLLSGRHPHDIERAHREAQILAALSHPAIVRHVAHGVTPTEDLYLVMAWVDGVTAAERLAREGFTLREAVAMVRRIAGALAAAHRAQVLHRDIKPSNVLLANDDPAQATLIDFGVSRIGDAVQSLTQTGVTIGTPGYMSPEQARGEKQTTPATDVFGLACLLYECASAKPAFSGMHPAAVMVKILFGEPVPLAQHCPEVPPALTALLARMLVKSASQRLAACDEVIAALDAIAIPDGPRRSTRSQLTDATVRPVPATELNCFVSAARGNPGDVLEPPTPAQQDALYELADAHHVVLEIMATGGVVVHVTGPAREAASKAAVIALEMKPILKGWSIAVSSVRADVGDVAEGGAQLLTSAAMSAIFVKTEPAIVVDPSTATLLSGEFELQAGREPKLIKRR